MKQTQLGLLIAGGGTGGHILAGVAVADVWKNQIGSPVLFVGAQGGIEEKLVPRAGYTLRLLQIGSLNRVSWKKKLRTLVQLPLSFIRSGMILMQERPRFVMGVGGYSSGPLVLMSWLLRTVGLLSTHIAILEQNSVPGLTNRILGRFVDVIFTAFPTTSLQFKGRPGESILMTGNPVRSAMKLMPSASRDPFVVFIFGGSQGALGINTLILEAIPYLDFKRIRLVHQTGEKDYDRVCAGYRKAGVLGGEVDSVVVEKFIYDMPRGYQEASLLICRAGSSTLSELAAVGRASILIPLPTATDNHQEKNARVFSDVGAALILLQQDSRGMDLSKQIQDLIEHPEQLAKMESRVTQFFLPNAAQDIVTKLLSLS